MQSGRKNTLQERYAIKFCFKLGKNVTETYGMLQAAFGASCMNLAMKRFENTIYFTGNDIFDKG